jgi:hypothetical protein
VDGPPAGADRQQIMQFMTTLSSAIIGLALVAQVSGALGRAFETFALVLLPVVYFLGVATDDPWASLAALGVYERRVFRRDMDTSPVAFADPAGDR